MLYRSGEEDSMLALGFIAKHAEDLAPLTKIICGDKANKLNLDRDVDINVSYYHSYYSILILYYIFASKKTVKCN